MYPISKSLCGLLQKVIRPNSPKTPLPSTTRINTTRAKHPRLQTLVWARLAGRNRRHLSRNYDLTLQYRTIEPQDSAVQRTTIQYGTSQYAQCSTVQCSGVQQSSTSVVQLSTRPTLGRQ